MWLGLYQSASIWLCAGPTCAPQRRPSRRCRSAGGPSPTGWRRRAPRTATSDEERLRPRRSGRHGDGVGASCGLPSAAAAAPLAHAAPVRTRLPARPSMPAKLERHSRRSAIWIDLLESDPGGGEARRDSASASNVPTREEMARSSRRAASTSARRALHDRVGAATASRTASRRRDPVSFILTRQAAGHGPLHRSQAVPRRSSIMLGADENRGIRTT